MSRTLKEKKFICVDCGSVFYAKANRKTYCNDCANARTKETKRKWYIKNVPNAYAPIEKHFCVACGIPADSSFNGDWYCNKHWLRMYCNGTLEPKKRKINNSYEHHEDYVFIYTANGNRIIVDSNDFDRVKNHSWCIREAGYAVSRINDKIVNMHRLIMDAPQGKSVDHINHDKLDNRKSNLRICDQINNSKNHSVNSPYGISGIKKVNDKYLARIMVNHKNIDLGRYESIEDAIHARVTGELKYYGEFSPFYSSVISPNVL